ncbi:amidohydrolase family protein [Plastorhodobacter daqingensis]|uniref:Amidohydrolase family protein n=1 Tax=Plastorhodobacter daqingensis TaxID=1387281 RepID=A0ABW2UMZ9_9RHOB
MTTDTMERSDAADGARLSLIDCDVHPRLPRMADLSPHSDRYWAEMFAYRNIDRQELMAYPVSTLPYRPQDAGVTTDAAGLARAHLDPNGISTAILNVMSGAHAAYDPYLAAAMCEATNRWLAAEWLDADPRLRGSLLVPFQHPEAAVREIERCAGDGRFVQVLTVLMGEKPLGRREYWPIYRAMAEHGFALGIHAGSTYRHAPTQCGFFSYRVEEAAAQTQAFSSQVASLVAEGVFGEFPDLRVVLHESGVSWLPSLMWRMSKDWKGARIEVPWVKVPPAELIATHVRMTTQPFDGPGGPDAARVVAQLEHDMLLYASDFPHAHAGGAGLPHWLPAELHRAVARDNALSTYARLEVADV